MSEDVRWFLVMYDIRDPVRWRRAHRVVRGFGLRVQYSIFRFQGTRRTMEQLRFALAKELTEEDDLLIVELCPSCAARVRERNPGGGWPDDDDGCKIL